MRDGSPPAVVPLLEGGNSLLPVPSITFHLTHHLFPHRPAAALPRCHAGLLRDETYGALA